MDFAIMFTLQADFNSIKVRLEHAASYYCNVSYYISIP